MGKKTGKRATYITYGRTEVSDKINGKDVGVSFNKSTNSYYTMIPKELAGKGAKRSKKVWLKSDVGNAVLMFRALVKKLKGEKNKKVTVIARIKDVPTFEGTARLKVDEQQYIKWLKKELQNPSELAKKTGIDAFNHFYDWMLEVPITLDTLIDNYFKLRKKPITKKEKQKTESTWSIFCKLIGKKTVQEVCLADIQKYEDYIHSKDYAPATISHYLNRLAKVFNYNCDKFEDNDRIIKIAKWCGGMERLEVIKGEPEIIELVVFEKLYNNTNIVLVQRELDKSTFLF